MSAILFWGNKVFTDCYHKHPRGVTEVLSIQFDNDFVHLSLDTGTSLSRRILWTEPRTETEPWKKGGNQTELKGFFSDEQTVNTDINAMWRLRFKWGLYILCDAISIEISKAVEQPLLIHEWDKAGGLKGTAECFQRNIMIGGPCDVGQSASIVIFSYAGLLRTLKSIVEKRGLPNDVSNLILKFASIGGCA